MIENISNFNCRVYVRIYNSMKMFRLGNTSSKDKIV